jgi:4-alpha-glucanotransferase
MVLERGSGILMHITSLPGAHGIGDLGRGAYEFIDFLAAAAQSYWQFLPVGPVSMAFDNSPYTSLSAMAGNPMLISPDLLREEGLLLADDFVDQPEFSAYYVEFERVNQYKEGLLRRAFRRFQQHGPISDFDRFCREEFSWLDDYALFMANREENARQAWYNWPRPIAVREEASLNSSRAWLFQAVEYYKFLQYIFFRQWRDMRRYARDRGITLIGDIPIYVGMDSADVWAHQDCFKLDDRTLRPTHVAGVPPDYFSETGQRWGNPLYRWKVERGKDNQALYDWWRQRFRQIFRTVDIVRIDHFRGIEAYWEIPDREETAVNGRWIKGPGKKFFREMTREIEGLPIIAEDLGVITPEVEALREEFHLPGMKVLQFAFDSGGANPYLPHAFQSPDWVIYSGTHDNDTTVGWFHSDKVDQASKQFALRYADSCNRDGSRIHWDFIKMAFSSVAAVAIIPMQDILGFGSDCRMNVPSGNEGNWRWRLAPQFLTENICLGLREMTILYGRDLEAREALRKRKREMGGSDRQGEAA